MFYKITSILHCPEGIDFWSTGPTPDPDYTTSVLFFFLYPGYLVNTSDLFGNQSLKYDSYLGKPNAITWHRTWYSKEYYDRYRNRLEIKEWYNKEEKYRKLNGISYLEETELVEPKYTANKFKYLGTDYVFTQLD